MISDSFCRAPVRDSGNRVRVIALNPRRLCTATNKRCEETFFFPFCLSVTFALISSLLVSVTFVPVVGAFLLRPGDLTEGDDTESSFTAIQKIYKPTLEWALTHKLASVGIAVMLCVASLGLLRFIPVTLFPAGPDRYISIDISVLPSATAEEKDAAVLSVESELERLRTAGNVENYLTTIGGMGIASFPGVGSLGSANIFVNIDSSAPGTWRSNSDNPTIAAYKEQL